MEQNELKKQFEKYLISQGLSEKTRSGNPSTVYDYITNIQRVCRNKNMSVDDIVVNIFNITNEYKGKIKTALNKFNEFLFETELPKSLSRLRNQNILCIIAETEAKTEELSEDIDYYTTTDLAKKLCINERVIKRWRKERIRQGKQNQVHENPYGKGKIGPKFAIVGGKYRYYFDDLKEYFGRDVSLM